MLHITKDKPKSKRLIPQLYNYLLQLMRLLCLSQKSQKFRFRVHREALEVQLRLRRRLLQMNR